MSETAELDYLYRELAAARAEAQQLRTLKDSLIAEMNQRVVDARNDRQRLFERIQAAEAEVARLRSELEALKERYKIEHDYAETVRAQCKTVVARLRGTEQK